MSYTHGDSLKTSIPQPLVETENFFVCSLLCLYCLMQKVQICSGYENQRSIAINPYDCMYSNPRDVILENAPNILAEI